MNTSSQGTLTLKALTSPFLGFVKTLNKKTTDKQRLSVAEERKIYKVSSKTRFYMINLWISPVTRLIDSPFSTVLSLILRIA